MRTIRLRCETRTEIDGRVRREYGEAARVVAVEEVLTGGIGGFFARRHLDVSVEIPDVDDEPTPRAPAPDGGHAFSSRSGIARLLEEADADELVTGEGRAPVSTTGRDFESLLHALSTDVGAETAAAPAAPIPIVPGTVPVITGAVPTSGSGAAPLQAGELHAVPLEGVRGVAPVPAWQQDGPSPSSVDPGVPRAVTPPPLFRTVSRAPAAPRPLSGPGDLVVVAGFAPDALEAAVLLARRSDADQVFDAGSVRGNSRRRVDDRRSALVARASGVQSGRAAVVAFGLDSTAGGLPPLADLEADQIWLAVDVSRKVADTDLWVGQVRQAVPVHGVIPTGELFTASPETVDLLGLPILRRG